MNKFRFLTLTASVGFMLTASVANAVPITGSFALSNGFQNLPGPGATSIVSNTTFFNLQPTAAVDTATGSFAGVSSPATTSDFDITNLPQVVFQTSGFSFTLNNAQILAEQDLTCSAGGLCTDNIALDLTGVVTGPGDFEPTEFLGSFTANGSCIGANGTCTEESSASWSASLSATGETVPTIPEPASIALLGLGLVGMAAARRRLAS